MQVKPRPGRRKFANEWDEINYLYDKVLYWRYQRDDARKARPYAERLERLLPRAIPTPEAVFGEECWSLVYETKGDLPRAIKHREKEVYLSGHLDKAITTLQESRQLGKAHGLPFDGEDMLREYVAEKPCSA